MSGIQPSALSVDELLRYAHLENRDGLSRDWVDALLYHLDDAHEERKSLRKRHEELLDEHEVLNDVVHALEGRVEALDPPPEADNT